jgi:RNA recognition motif-containing protein
MDINSLLSPDPESSNNSPKRPASSASPRSPAQSPIVSNGSNNGYPPRPSNHPRKSSQLSQQVTFSSDDDHSKMRHNLPAKTKRPAMNSPGRRYSSVAPSIGSVPTSLGPMDALAEAASRQRPQTILWQHEKQSSTSSTQTVASRSAVDAVMPDASPSPNIYEFSSLPPKVSQELAKWAKRVSEDPFDIKAHTQLVQQLHQEFVAHVESGKTGHSFEPVTIMQKARKAMSKIFPIGEDLWLDWLTDENILSRTIDDRISVMDLHAQSVNEEVSSAPLWRRYGDYMYYLWSSANSNDSNWSEEDKEVGLQVFTWESMIDVWDQGVFKTQCHINDSNLVWDRYMEILLGDLSRHKAPEKVNFIRDKFIERLTTRPHLTWDQTFSMFSQFITAYDAEHYEQTMANISERSSKVKQLHSTRETFEFKIQQAQDKDAEYDFYTEYLAWELDNRGVFSMDLINGLFERATARFPTSANLWIDYVELLIETPIRDIPVLNVLERATRHCPWSGDLWSHRILTMESEDKTFEEIEEVKHTATASGLVDVNGFEDLMKVYIAWCGYLRRRASRPSASEDDIDMAEMGILSSIEHAIQAGQKKYGNDFKGDPSYRLERIHIKFLYQRKDYAAVKSIMNRLIDRNGDSYDFWYRYYLMAMIIWGAEHYNINPANAHPPREATQILENAISRVETLDMPEHLVPMYLNHCEQHETVQYYRSALIKARHANKKIESRRARERKAWQDHYDQQKLAEAEAEKQQSETTEAEVSKRKRAEEADSKEHQPKKQKQENGDDAMEIDEAPKRDRENTTLVMRGLPEDVTVTKIRHFFKDSGTINDVHIFEEQGSKVAMVEFETKDDALYGQTRSAKPFEGESISIDFSTGSTLWVTNYPPTADEKYIRNLFEEVSDNLSSTGDKLTSKKYGEVAQVRFPSLKGNTQRRFCYVQFLSPTAAQKATELNGKVLDGKFHLQAKISDPTAKEHRHGALAEGREVFVNNVQFKASEVEVKDHFERFGPIESVRIPTKMNGMGKGVAFISFKSKEDAEKALEFNNTAFQDRTITVEISVPKSKRQETHRTNNDTPEAESVHSASGEQQPTDGHYKERSVALMNLHDTVNLAQLEKAISECGESAKKITLRPQNAGAIVEMVTKGGVGKLTLALDGKELGGMAVRVGAVGELFKQKPIYRNDTFAKKKTFGTSFGSGVVNRPGARGGRGGRGGMRGGLFRP